MSQYNSALDALQILEAKDFRKDEIGRLVGYIDERQQAIAREEAQRTREEIQRALQPSLDRINAEFAAIRSEMVSRKLAWSMFLAVMVILIAIAPEAVSKAIALLK